MQEHVQRENCAESFGICSGDAPVKRNYKLTRATVIQATRVAARRSITELSKPVGVGAAFSD